MLGLGQARWLRCKTPLSRMNLKNTIFPWLACLRYYMMSILHKFDCVLSH